MTVLENLMSADLTSQMILYFNHYPISKKKNYENSLEEALRVMKDSILNKCQMLTLESFQEGKKIVRVRTFIIRKPDVLLLDEPLAKSKTY